MPFIKCNKINIHYQVHGQGEALILISGLGGDSPFWQTSLEILSKCYKVITYDTRGSGKSDAADGPYSRELHAADLAESMDGLQIRKAYILGFSMGENIALTFAHLYPERVSKPILAATFAVVNAQARLFLDAVLSVYEKNRCPELMFDLIAPWLFLISFISNLANKYYLYYDENEADPQSFDSWKNLYLAMQQFDISGSLTKILVPMLVIAGDEDRLADVEDGRFLAQRLPNSMLLIIPKTGHLINFEQPKTFHEGILNFLG